MAMHDSEPGVVHQVFGEPVVVDGHTIIPMTDICQALGGGMSWFSARPAGVVTLDADGVHIHHRADFTRLITVLLLTAAWNVFWVFRAARRGAAH